MTAAECLEHMTSHPALYQLPLNEFVDAFRAASPGERVMLVAPPREPAGHLAALLAATVSYLCHETGTTSPTWIDGVRSPEPFFVLPARSLEMRARLMIESPPPFKMRRVFVPENFLSRA